MLSSVALSPYLWFQFGTVVCLLVLFLYSWHRRSVPGALPFAIGSLFAAIWVSGALMEYAAAEVDDKIFWVKVQAACQLPAVTAVTFFVLEYAWPGRWQTRRNVILLSIPSLLFLLLILTNDLHQLVWRGFVYNGAIIPVRGPVNWLFILYGMLLTALELTIFAWLFVRSPPHRWPVVIMAMGQIGARIVYMFEAAGVIQSVLPLDVIVIAYLFVLYAIALFGFRLLDPIALATKKVIEQLHEGLVVVDPTGQVASLNSVAQTFLGVSAKHAVNRPIRELLPAYVPEADEPIEIALDSSQGVRCYEFENLPLNDWRGLEVGRLLLLRDVTEQKKIRAQVLEQQRALAILQERERLARELHDSTGQVLSYVSMQTQAIRKLLGNGRFADAETQLDRLTAVAAEAHADIRESILKLKTGSGSTVQFLGALKEYLDTYSDNYGLHAELALQKDLSAEDFTPDTSVQLLRVVGEALTNARKHSGANRVQVSLVREGQHARIVIADDGYGFDASQLAASESHFGLAFMQERMAQVGGDVKIDSRPGGGTHVALWVPIRDRQREEI